MTVHCQSPGPSWCHELGAPQSPRLPSWMLFQPRPLPGASGRRISALLCTIGGGLPRFKTLCPVYLSLTSKSPQGLPHQALLSFTLTTAWLACVASYYWLLTGLEEPTLLFPCSSLAEVLPKVSCLGSHHILLSVSSHILLAGVSSTEILQGQR